MTPEKELEALIVTKLIAALPSGVQAVRKQQIASAATLPRVSVACDVSTENQALAQVGVFSINVDAIAEFDAITGSDPASVIQQTIDSVDATLLNWPTLADSSVVCLGGTFGAGSTTNDEDRLTRTISGVLWARRRVLTPTGNIVVSGAGTGFVNSLYVPTGTENGRTKYLFAGEGTEIVWNGFDGWNIKQAAVNLYFGLGDVATPDLVPAWEVGTGQAPAPTVAAELIPI
jgi:hypothetical protein